MIHCLREIICEAKCCAVDYAAGFADLLTFGRDNPEKYYDYLMLMTYIDMLERNYPEYVTVKEKVAIVPQKINFSSLQKENNTLHLNVEERVICTKVQIDPCLSDSDMIKIIEQIKKYCSNCNCNCN